MNIAELESMTSVELQELARNLGLSGIKRFRKKELIIEILKVMKLPRKICCSSADSGITLRDTVSTVDNCAPSPDDVYVSPSQIRRFPCAPGTKSWDR